MKIKILDNKTIDNKHWYLGCISLWEYLCAINTTHFQFDIQRGIIKNQYLDSILLSIKNGEPFPPITIISNDVSQKEGLLDITNFEILDGLQRTYRLWVYKLVADIVVRSTTLFGDSIDGRQTLIKLKENSAFIPGAIPISLIRPLLDESKDVNVNNLKKLFSGFNVYLYIWDGLNDKEIIQKMLILNAGQKRVSNAHQYEIMFMHILRDETKYKNVRLVRVKEEDYGKVKIGNRKIGEFVFSSIIIGLQSFIAQKPLRLGMENLELNTDDDFISLEITDSFFNQPFLNAYLTQLYEWDQELYGVDKEYLRWFVKDTTISGLMGAFGKAMTGETFGVDNFNKYMQSIRNKIKESGYFHINEFYNEYNALASTRINIGDVVRQAIYQYTLAIIQDNFKISWKDAFNKKY